jgi:hypothetical protein
MSFVRPKNVRLLTRPFAPPTNPYSWYTDDPAAPIFYIYYYSQLAALANIVNGTANSNATVIAPPQYYGGNDISAFDFAGRKIMQIGDISFGVDIYEHDAVDWVPIGTEARRFAGEYDGGGNVISDMTVNNGVGQGIFGHIRGAQLHDIGISNVQSIGEERGGALVGHGYRAEIRRCYAVNSSLRGQNGWTENPGLGGLVGFVDYTVISDCFCSVSVRGGAYVGGLVGYLSMDSVVENCYTANPIVSGGAYSGGLIGEFAHGRPEVRNCAVLNNPAMSLMSLVGSVYDTTLTEINNIIFDSGAPQQEILSGGTIGGRFTRVGGWSVDSLRLPGLAGQTRDMPSWIQ